MTEVLTTEKVPLAVDAHGVIRVSGTRVTLDTIVGAFQDGATADEIAQQYDSVPLADIYQVIGYYLHHAADLVPYFEERQRRIAEVHREIEARSPQDGFRQRLLARQRQR